MGMNFGKKMALLRGTRSLAEVARGCGCLAEHVRRMEAGAVPGLKIALAAARHFEVDLGWLADGGQGWPPPATDRRRAAELVERALARAGLDGELTAAERALLASFRSLTPGEQCRATGFVEGLAAGTRGCGFQPGRDV